MADKQAEPLNRLADAARVNSLAETAPGPQEAEEVLRQMASTFALLEPGSAQRNGSERERARYELQKAEARFRTLVEQIPAVTFMAAIDEGVNELYVSPQIEALLGFSQKEWLEDPVLWYNQLHPEDRERWHIEFARTCAFGTEFRSEYRFMARDGRVVWVHGEAQVVRDEQGHPLFLQGIAYDITERKKTEEVQRRLHEDLERLVRERTAELGRTNETLQAEIQERGRLEEALRQRAQQLSEEGRRKDHFLATLAHELRNPLAPLRNALHILRQPGVGETTARWAHEMMGRQVQQLTRLIDDLLDVSRINQGKIELRRECVDLATVVIRAVETTRSLVEERRHQLTVALPVEPVALEADPVRLEQVLVNLLTNAARYTEPGGRIEVSVAAEAQAAVLRVRDNGMGLPPDMLERVFDLFTQVNHSLSRSNQWGLGIGLTLVRSLVELHGGRVSAVSPGLGQGSEFVVRLPRLTPVRPTTEAVLPRAAAARRQQTILLVDDNVDLAESLALLLRWWGHEVHVAHDGPSALVAAQTHSPTVVLVDIGLPGMDGYEVARRLRQQAGSRPSLLVALTGYGQDKDRRRSREAGFDHHLTKPVEPEALQRLLANFQVVSTEH